MCRHSHVRNFLRHCWQSQGVGSSTVHCDDRALPHEHPVARYGLPVTTSLLVRDGFIAQVDLRTRNPTYVIERLTSASAFGEKDRTTCQFYEDTTLPPRMRSRLSDYKSSGFDRGHLAPAADHRHSEEELSATFSLSNVAPQHPALNRQYWQRVESFVRNLVHPRSRFQEAFVITGPLYLPDTTEGGADRLASDGDGATASWRLNVGLIGEAPQLVHVPTHFYKVVVMEEPPSGRNAGEIGGALLVCALVVPNAPVEETIPLEHFFVPLEALEEAAGLLFFPELLDATTRERCRVAEAPWIAPLRQPPVLLAGAKRTNGRSRVPTLGNSGRCVRHLCDGVHCELPSVWERSLP